MQAASIATEATAQDRAPEALATNARERRRHMIPAVKDWLTAVREALS